MSGRRYAASTKIPASCLELSGKADEEWQFGLLLRISDMLGNPCDEGGAAVSVCINKAWLHARPEIDQVNVEKQPVCYDHASALAPRGKYLSTSALICLCPPHAL